MIARFPGAIVRYFTRRDKNLRVPALGNFGRLYHDVELYGSVRDVGQKVAIPSTRQFMMKPDFVTVPDAWAWRWVEMLRWAACDMIDQSQAKALWRSIIKNHTAFTDNHSPENGYRDPITNENPLADNIAWATLGMTGNIVKIIGTYGDYRVIEALDFTQPPPPLGEIILKPWLWQWATIVNLDGTMSNFPHLEAILETPAGLPVPIVSVGGTQWVHYSYFERVENGSLYDPYR
jgi:hypothetical protein